MLSSGASVAEMTTANKSAAALSHYQEVKIGGSILLCGRASMDEQEFDSRFPGRPFVREDAMQADVRAGRSTALAVALWGNADCLQRQLLAPHPEVPSGFELADLRELQQRVLVFQWLCSSRDLARRFPTFMG